MSLTELFILAVGLSMDAFAVSICKGLSIGTIKWKHMAIAGLWFGGFQALMPLIGYFCGSFFNDFVSNFSHWIGFALLAIIGGNMIREALSKEEEEEMDCSLSVQTMFLLAVATSIDALAVGVSFAFLKVNIIWAVSFIGVVTFVLSAIGIKVGSVFGKRYERRAEFVGGVVLIGIGIKILLDGLGIL